MEALQQATQEEQQRKSKGRKKGRIRELEEIRSELAEKELVLLGKEQELLDKDQTVEVLRKEVPLFSHTPFGHHLAVPHADTLLPIRCTSSWHSRHCRRHAIAAVAVALLRLGNPPWMPVTPWPRAPAARAGAESPEAAHGSEEQRGPGGRAGHSAVHRGVGAAVIGAHP